MAQKRVIVRHLQAIQNFGAIDILCSDKTGTLTEGRVPVANLVNRLGGGPERLRELAHVNAAFDTGLRNALDDAISALDGVVLEGRWTKRDELPFDFVRRRASVVATGSDSQVYLITKGAPESVLPVCDRYQADGPPAPLGPAERARVDAAF